MSPKRKIGLRDVRALKPGETIWDSAVTGFGARRQRSEAVSYFVFYRTKAGRQRWHTIGRHGAPWTPDEARDEARRILGEVARGDDPAAEKKVMRDAMDVASLCDLYLADVEAGNVLTKRRVAKKASTIVTDRGRIERHIKPLLGGHLVRSVATADVREFQRKVANGATAVRIKTERKRGLANVRGGKGTASRTVGLLGAIFTYAQERGFREDNPVRGVVRPADGRRERRVTDEEYARIGRMLAESVGSEWPPFLAAARFIIASGWRLSDVLDLDWSYIDRERRIAVLPDTKSGRSVRPLSLPACAILDAMPGRHGRVFCSSRGGGRLSGFDGTWARLVNNAGLPGDITSHVFRHSFVSLGNDLGYSEATLADIVGQKRSGTTSRYIHTVDSVLIAAADVIAGRINELLIGGPRDVKDGQ